MVLVSNPEKPFTFTGKGTPRRQAIINEYKPEIEALYAAADESAQADLEPPSTWTISSSTDFVREVVSRVMEIPVEDNDDIFSLGCDRYVNCALQPAWLNFSFSLQATWIRNSLLRALRVGSTFDVKQVPSNFVYQHPTITVLSELMNDYANGRSESGGPDGAIKAMLAMVDKYSRDFATHRPGTTDSRHRVFIVTGTTGGLGCALLAHLSGLPDVQRIYAVNRSSKVALSDRQRTGLANRGYDAQRILREGKIVLLDAATAESNLGLKPDVYEEVIDISDYARVIADPMFRCVTLPLILFSTVSMILSHFPSTLTQKSPAWPVNFNLSLRTFEPNVRSVRHFVDLSLSSPHRTPPRILFTSSISVLRRMSMTSSTIVRA